MAVTITHTTPADGTFSATGAAAWDANHAVSGLGTMAEQDANNVNITGGSITGVTGVLSSLTVNSTPTSGGAAGQIMFDTGSVLQESSNLVWDNTNKKLTITGATVTTSQPVLDMTQTWNNASTVFTGVKLNISNTASNASSKFLDLQLGGTTFFQVNGYGQFLNGNSTLGYTQFGLYVAAGDAQPVITFGNTNVGSSASNYGIMFGPGGANTTDVGLFRAASGVLRLNSGVAAAAASLGTLLLNQLNFATGNTNTADLILTRRGAANLRLGAADAAAPVAQTLSVQSVVAGTSNTAGANLTITGSQGTGTGAGGSIIFQVAPAGSSGTAQNALSTALTINSNTSANFANAVFSPTGFRSSVNSGGISLNENSTLVGIYSNNALQAYLNGTTWAFGSTITLAWSSTAASSGSNDLFVRRRGAANLQLGAADAAAPVAQTLSVQSVVAGTSNTAGANLTITGSQGTGTGAGGSIIFQTAPAGSTGTAQNALSNALTINSSQNIIVGGAGTTSTGGTGTAAISFGGNTNVGFISTGGGLGVMHGGNTVAAFRVNEVRISSTLPFGFASGQDPTANGLDVFLTRRGAANLRLGAADAAAPVAQTLSVQSVVAGTSNTAGANLTITGSQGTGTGAGGDIIFQTALAGTSGTAQNTLTTALRIYSNQTVAVGKAYTVATLPAAGTQGRRAWVTDATAPTFLGALTGGGAVVCPVFDDGTAWVAG